MKLEFGNVEGKTGETLEATQGREKQPTYATAFGIKLGPQR
jgi:hypothetical protein